MSRPDGFHWQDGWYFRRTEDGSVHILKVRQGLQYDPRIHLPQAEAVIDAASWASIVASVTPQGENAETFAAAQRLHEGAQA